MNIKLLFVNHFSRHATVNNKIGTRNKASRRGNQVGDHGRNIFGYAHSTGRIVIPGDHKWFRNLAVSHIILDTLEGMDMQFPECPYDLSEIDTG